MHRTRTLWVVPALVLGAAVHGCSREAAPEFHDRYVRLVRPFEGEWRRESEIPAAPQRYPHMVIWEVSGYPPGATPSAEQERAADELIERCRAAAEEHGWYDFEKGLADGFAVTDDERHYENRSNLLDDRILDCDRPEYLMYYPGSNGTRELVGFMFYARTPEERGPQIGGPLTVWHFHRWSNQLCTVDGLIQVGWEVNGVCEEGVGTYRSPEMLHLWLVDRPEGPFSTSMYLEDHLELEGLDAPFVAPEGDDVELFGAQLDAALEKLDDADRRLVAQAISYLVFAFGRGVTELGVARPVSGDPIDPEARGRMALLRAAQKRGAQMRLRVFVGMAFELDKVRPELWKEYEAIHGREKAPHSHH